jgi:hypothetical protein
MFELDIEKLKELVIELKVLESSDLFDDIKTYGDIKEFNKRTRVFNLSFKIKEIEKEIMSMLKEVF